VGGDFTAIGGQDRHGIATLEANSGAATAWNPDPNGVIYSIEPKGSTVYVGGYFSRIGGQRRASLAALDSESGTATAWNPNCDAGVTALAASGSTVYLGGDFYTIGRQPRRFIAAVDARTGLPTDWNPEIGSGVTCLALQGPVIYVGKYFVRPPLPGFPGGSDTGFAALPLSDDARSPGNHSFDESVIAELSVSDRQFALSAPSPNPVVRVSDLSYAIPSRGHVRLCLVDVRGRVVAVLVDEVCDAGNHTVRISTERIPSGIYFARLQAAGKELIRRVVALD